MVDRAELLARADRALGDIDHEQASRMYAAAFQRLMPDLGLRPSPTEAVLADRDLFWQSVRAMAHTTTVTTTDADHATGCDCWVHNRMRRITELMIL